MSREFKTKSQHRHTENLLEFFATCPFGFEEVVAAELKSMRMYRVRPLNGGVSFQGSPKDAYRACLWSRAASRIMLVIDRVDAKDADTLYQSVKAIPWEEHMSPAKTMAVFARGSSKTLRNTAFIGQKVKDAICDRLREVKGSRPNVDSENPDLGIWVNLHGARATINIDFAGGSLHRRGYREEGVQVAAPLKEALAAGMLLKASWHKQFSNYETFVDPMCGSGTLVIEAAMMAADRAPGLLREKWGFEGWLQYQSADFFELLDEADERFEAGLAKSLPMFIGSDIDPRCIELAKACALRAGVGKLITFVPANCKDLPALLSAAGAQVDKPGFVAVNPPYGIRLAKEDLRSVTESLRQGIEALPENWKMIAITPDPDFDVSLAMDAYSVTKVYNGRIESSVRMYDLGASRLETLEFLDLEGNERKVGVSSGHAEQFAARLRKVAKQRRKWAQRENVFAYRVYDADLPDYAVAIDLVMGMRIQDPVEEQRAYDSRHKAKFKGRFSQKNSRENQRDSRRSLSAGRNQIAMNQGLAGNNISGAAHDMQKRGFVHVRSIDAEKVQSYMKPYLVISEYQAPKDIDPTKAARRLDDAIKIAALMFDIPEERIATRVRKQEKGGSQYAAKQRKGMYVLTVEGGHVFELDLTGYLDIGLFFDHRPVRSLIEAEAKDKRFCNLFAYTGSASVYAAAGGAKSCATVDLSPTYLEWARRNMQRNGFRDKAYRFSKADTLDWLNGEQEKETIFDLVFVDPPTFSNSKAMGKRTWDIQRDHIVLLSKIARVLAPEGSIIFSGNLRSFKLDLQGLKELGLVAKDITAQTIPEDFARNKKIHFCYRIMRA